ncbi:MAG TPA: arginase [Candidatus Saccharimonadales bacterium]|nr:arginase [Candidatus Saccharimonadales bacterium]
MKTTIIGIPIDLGAENSGVAIGPDAFRYKKLVEKLNSVGFELTDEGNISCSPREQVEIGNPKLKYLTEILRISEESAEKTLKAIERGEKVIALGGDHSLCLGVISGASVAVKGELGLIYLDAHGDMNTTESTLTGNIHGMPLAALMGFGDKQLLHVYKPTKKISKENMLHIGGNDFDPGELELIEKKELNVFKTVDMLSEGLKPLFTKIDELSKRVKNIWVSLDLDVIDEMYAPGVGMPNKAGLTYREITTIADYIGKKPNVLGIDINEYNPLTDVDGKTAELGIELIAKILGGNYSWYTNYMESKKIK